MQKEQSGLKTRFDKIFSGSSSLKEREQMSRWLSRMNVTETQLSFDEIENRRLQLQQIFHEGLAQKKIWTLQRWLSATAAALLLIGGLLFFIPLNRPPAAEVYTQTSTRTGERKIVKLSDGSVISLNNASVIKYPQVFTSTTRQVYLEGEAFFEIKHDIKKSFIVYAGKLKVQVLGTSFDIHSYKSDRKTEVTVRTGKVGVMAYGKKMNWMLTPGQQLSYNDQTDTAVRLTVNTSDYTAWQKGTLIFNNEKLETICKRLERWYGVNISINTNTLKNKRISLKFHNESLQTVLKMLGMAAGFEYEIEDKTVKIRKDNMTK